MPEVMFVIKAFAISLVLTVCLQVKVGNSSLETHADNWIRTSSLPIYLQKVSEGAVLAIRNASGAAKDFLGQTFGKENTTQRAGRLNFEFKRSAAHQESAKDNNY